MKKENVSNIIFRVDSSKQIGSGHMMRCLTLARQLKANGVVHISFISRDLEGSIHSLAEKEGFPLFLLPRHEKKSNLSGYASWLSVPQEVDAEDTIEKLQQVMPVDWLIVDSYAIDRRWESLIRSHVKHMMAIDDIANRPHDVDLLLDQNFPSGREASYQDLVTEECRLLIGPRYLLLREEFYLAKAKQLHRNGNIRRVLVFFGGIDLTNETAKALDALEEFPEFHVDVVVGGGNPWREEIRQRCANRPTWNFHCQVNYMADLMAEADLSIGAGGSTTWERCYLGLPSMVIAVADNQSGGAEFCASQGIFYYLGKSGDVKSDDIAGAIRKFQEEPALYSGMQKGMEKVFENHSPHEVAKILCGK